MEKARPLIVGIAGGIGSGKSSLTDEILSKYPGSTVRISHDYYRSQDTIPLVNCSATNYDDPSTLETDLLIKHLAALSVGQSIERPTYDFVKHNRLTLTNKKGNYGKTKNSGDCWHC